MESKDPFRLLHSEIIPEINRSNLAGIRLPLEKNPERKTWSVRGEYPMDNHTLISALQDFAEQMGVPIYRFPEVNTIDQEIMGLKRPFKGEWIKGPSGDYTTSSELGRILGITELP
jgi:hypothetical protein